MNGRAVPAARGFTALPAGSRIGVIAPAGPAEPDRLAAVPALYAAWGYEHRLYPGCTQRSGYLAGDDGTRLADLHAALSDADIDAIHCLRGGYGCMWLLDRIDTALVRRAGKLLIGYSDITALHALWRREGLASLHAPMPASDLLLPGREADADALQALLRGGLLRGDVLAPALLQDMAALTLPGVAEGPLLGGNLSLVAALLGTPWAWDLRGAVLLLEDVSEARYRVDRLLVQLHLAGVFRDVAGVVLGSYTRSEDPQGLLHELLLPWCRAAGKPVLGGWPAGHGTPNRPLPLGVRVRLDAGAGTITLLGDFLRPTPLHAK